MGCIFEESPNNVKGITGKEAQEVANLTAMDWDVNATLIFVTGSSSHLRDGKFEKITFRYWNLTQNENNCLEISVSNSLETQIRKTNRHHEQNIITNWTIDSDEAYEIAEANKQINNYLKEYDDAEVDSFHLSGGENNSSPEWWIYWTATDWGSPVNAHIVINAQTGDVIEVESDV